MVNKEEEEEGLAHSPDARFPFARFVGDPRETPLVSLPPLSLLRRTHLESVIQDEKEKTE